MKQYVKAKTVDISSEPLSERLALARDPATPSDILKVLYADKNSTIRHCVLSNPNTPIDVLNSAFPSEDSYDLIALAQNTSLPADLARKLAENAGWQTMTSLSRNPNTPTDVLDDMYARLPYDWMRKDFAENVNASPMIKEKYEEYKKSIAQIRAKVFEYVKAQIYPKLREVISDLENDELLAETVAASVKGYDSDWCAGEYDEESEALWDNALDTLVEYEVNDLFGELEL